MEFILGIDAGTHGVRVLIYDLESKRVVKRIKKEYKRENISHGLQEMKASDLLETFYDCIESIDDFFSSNDRVLALGITHQRGTIIPINNELLPLAAALCDSDERAIKSSEILKYGINENDYYETTGCPLVSFNGLTKILWCKENAVELFNKTYAWLSPQDYLLSNLGDEIIVTHGSILRNGYYNIKKREVASNIFDDLTPDFVKLKSMGLGEIVGKVKAKENIPKWLEDAYLVSVSGDQPSATIGAGIINTSEISMNLGTTFVLSLLSEDYYIDDNMMITNEILPNEYYAPEFGSGAGGQFMDWIVKLLFGTTDIGAGWQELDNWAQEIEAGSNGLYITPLLWQVTSPNVQGGIKRISSIHTRGHIIRGVYEGLGYEAKISLLTIQKASKKNISDIRVYGGMSRLPGFLQILSNITNKRITVLEEEEASALGAALTAATAIGRFDNIIEASRSIRNQIKGLIEPNPMEVDFYEKEFKHYREKRG